MRVIVSAAERSRPHLHGFVWITTSPCFTFTRGQKESSVMATTLWPQMTCIGLRDDERREVSRCNQKMFVVNSYKGMLEKSGLPSAWTIPIWNMTGSRKTTPAGKRSSRKQLKEQTNFARKMIRCQHNSNKGKVHAAGFYDGTI